MGISNIVSTSITDFVDYAMYVIVLFTIYYCFKFFFVDGLAKEMSDSSGWEERGKKWQGWIKDKSDKSKEKSVKKRKGNLVAPAKSHLVVAQEICDDVIDLIGKAKSAGDRTRILSRLHDFNEELHSVWGYLRLLRKNVDANEDKEYIKKRIHEVEATKVYVNTNLKGKLPPTVGSDWLTKVAPVLSEIQKVRGMAHNIWNEIEGFHS